VAKSYHLPPLDLDRYRREVRQMAREHARIAFRVVQRHRWLGRFARAVAKWLCG